MESSNDAPKTKNANKGLVLLSLTLAFTYTFISRFIWSALMNDVSMEFALNAKQAGAYMSAFFAGYLITQIPGGIMADKLQPKYIIMVCLGLGGLSTALMSTISSYSAGLVFRIITGISSGAIMACCSKIIAMVFPIEKRASAMGIVLASPPLGILIANAIGTPLNASFGWRSTFVIIGLISIVIIAAIFFFVPRLPKADGNQKKTGLLEGLKVFFTDKDQIILGFSGFMFMVISVGFATWANKYLGHLGFEPAQIGKIITIYSIGGIVASSFSGTIAQKLKMNHKQFLMLSLSLIAVMSFVFSKQTQYHMFVIIGLIFGAVSYLPSTHYTTWAIRKAGNQFAATASSTQNLMFQTSSMIQPIVIGAAIDSTGNYNLIWYIFMGCAVLAVLLVALINTNDKPKQA